MAGYTHGMNVDAVRTISNQLTQQAEQINTLIGSIGSQVSNAHENWSGPDSEQFQADWQNIYMPHLRQVEQDIRTYAQKAMTNVSNQESTSQAY